MTIEEIPADKLVKMTNHLRRLFRAGGCDPMCHCCEKRIVLRDQFKLATIKDLKPVYWDREVNNPESIHYGQPVQDSSTELVPRFEKSREVMLCPDCSSEMYQAKEMEFYKSEVKRILHPDRGCFRVNGKISKT